ncbi:toxin biosynthesis protein [Aspergillus ambiguus]|uniref:toxin biosynthesis protein n=1 Tax=Aspergillus ambiguus TaxID=176160 RepID=UPI003CCCECBB
MSCLFHIKNHVIDTQYIREYPRATATPDAPLKLCVKQYIPVDNIEPQYGDVTIIAAHGTGFPKELYEPLWEELLLRTKTSDFRIRAIWVADVANQGASGILNEQHLGNDPSWYDHSRDLIHMINHFRDQMPRPIIAVGHSLGATQLIFTSLFHPRLFASLLLIEPHVKEKITNFDSKSLLAKTSLKRDIWPSRTIAIDKARKVFWNWDPRVFQRWCEVGYRELPTAIHANINGDPNNRPVTLTSTKYQETMMYIRLNLKRHTELGLEDAYGPEGHMESGPSHDPLTVPDMLGPLPPTRRGYRPEPFLAFKLVPHLRPSVLYVSGSDSPLQAIGIHAEAARRTGTRHGGSGGMAMERVRHVVIDQASHTLPFEKIHTTSGALAAWIQVEKQRWIQNEARIAAGWDEKSLREKSTFNEEWREFIASLLKDAKMKSKI